MKAGTGGHHSGRVILALQQHQRMIGAAGQERAGDQVLQPGEDGREKRAKDRLHWWAANVLQ